MSKISRFIFKYKLVERHKNPTGVFMRIPVYLLLFWGLWSHTWFNIVFALLMELALWFLRPVEESLPFIEKVIAVEIAWFEAPRTWIKLVSYLFLSIALPGVGFGLWLHNWWIIAAGILFLIFFNLLMNYIGKSTLKIIAESE